MPRRLKCRPRLTYDADLLDWDTGGCGRLTLLYTDDYGNGLAGRTNAAGRSGRESAAITSIRAIMQNLNLTSPQLEVVRAPVRSRTFLHGVAGTGKTTVGVNRLHHLLDAGVSAGSVLVLVPQRTLAEPYYEALRQRVGVAGSVVTVATLSGLARRMVDLFWPMVAEDVGFAHPDRPPTFLTLETAQYYMALVAQPYIERDGFFESVTIERNRLYVQILSNLSKAAAIGFPPDEIAQRLKSAWMGESAQARAYDEAQICALDFRRYCLEHNLLDFSLQMSIFAEHLWDAPLCRRHLTTTYRNLIYDNSEEDTPVAHDTVYTWLGDIDSALVILDEGAGYRSFLSADPESAMHLQDLCDETVTFTRPLIVDEGSAPILALGRVLDRVLRPLPPARAEDGEGAAPASPVSDLVPLAPAPDFAEAPLLSGVSMRIEEDAGRDAQAASRRAAEIRQVLQFEMSRFHPEMLDWVTDQIRSLVQDEGMSPAEIVVLAPHMSDALSFSLSDRLERQGVAVRSHRPSRPLRSEIASQTLLTLTALAHPDWGIAPSSYDIAYALRHAIAELDLVRAQLLAEIVFRVREGQPVLTSFQEINPDMQQRITFLLGERYEALRTWLQDYAEGERAPLDHFLARLFGEVLSQPGYGFHRDVDSGQVAAMLIESVQKFRWASTERSGEGSPGQPLGQEYLSMVRQGVIAAQYLQPWREVQEDAVLIASAHTFLMRNQPVDVQFWLDVGSADWWGRVYQPLTHPYVLSRQWPVGKVWTDADEYALRQRNLHRLVMGLLRRCRSSIYLGLSEISEQGFEQQGPLLRAVQQVLKLL